MGVLQLPSRQLYDAVLQRSEEHLAALAGVGRGAAAAATRAAAAALLWGPGVAVTAAGPGSTAAGQKGKGGAKGAAPGGGGLGASRSPSALQQISRAAAAAAAGDHSVSWELTPEVQQLLRGQDRQQGHKAGGRGSRGDADAAAMSPADFASLAWGVACSGSTQPWAYAQQQQQQRTGSQPGHSAAAAAASSGTSSGMPPSGPGEAWLEALADASYPLLPACSPGQLWGLAWAFARLGHVPSEVGHGRLCCSLHRLYFGHLTILGT